MLESGPFFRANNQLIGGNRVPQERNQITSSLRLAMLSTRTGEPLYNIYSCDLIVKFRAMVKPK